LMARLPPVAFRAMFPFAVVTLLTGKAPELPMSMNQSR
jgi:hypothetical protein